MGLRRPKVKSVGLVTAGSDDAPVDESADPAAPAAPPTTSRGLEGVEGIAADESIWVPEESAELVPNGRKLGEILVEQGVVDQAAVDAAVAKQAGSGERIGALLVADADVSEAHITRALATQYDLPLASMANVSFDPQAVALIDEDTAQDLSVLAHARVGGTIHVVIADPARANLVATLQALVDQPMSFAVGAQSEVDAAIARAYQTTTAMSDAVRVFEARASERALLTTVNNEVDERAPVVQVVSMILTQAVRDRASDVHIEPMGERVRVRNRVDGALHEVLSLPQSMAQALVSRIKIMADMNIVERRRPQDGQIETVVDGNELDIRVSTTSTQHGEKTVLRILDKARALYDLDTLGMPPDTATVFSDIIRSPYGMVVCAGPTGSGKTTTLYATLMAINSDEINVMTVEDPVEYTFPTINQISIHEQAGVTFAAGLRSILRQDPDAILVGEIRDVETARIAIQAALTGHFVLSTIHATDATSALHRFLDMGIESFLLASSMLAVVGQRLIRRNCQTCLAPYEPTTEDLAFLERAGQPKKDVYLKGAGCIECSQTGYIGRIGVYEVLEVTDEMRNLIVRNATLDDIRALAVEQGMVPMRDQALRLVADDVTTVAEVMRTIYIL
ncbi:MAG: pilus biosynthesis protein PilB [Ilumatobacteraceae bacterium]|nr:pilus biosynthesis protein PilB [Ilumatobacteraceae bacterium]